MAGTPRDDGNSIKPRAITSFFPVLQAPMANTTDLAFRLLGRDHGMRFAFLEMISSEALVRDHKKTKELLKTLPQDRPIGVQIVGANPQVMGRAAQILDEMDQFEALDINRGCPVPKITGCGGGCSLMKEPQRAAEIFRRVVQSVQHMRVSVKMRTGYTDASGQEAVRLAQIAQECGIGAITIHARTRSQGYGGKADYQIIAMVKKAVSIPVIGNGDVVDGASALRLKEISGCDAIMIGRGSLGNPWIYRQAEEALKSGRPHPAQAIDPATRKRTLLRHLDLQVQCGGPRCYLPLRRITCWYIRGLSGAATLRHRINRAASVEEIREIVETIH